MFQGLKSRPVAILAAAILCSCPMAAPAAEPQNPPPLDTQALADPANGGEVQGSVSLLSLNAAVRSGQYELAYQQALSLLAAHEGDEQFDFPFGLAALETDHGEQALFVFERLRQLHPDNLRYRFELARAQWVTGKTAQARDNFQAVSEQDSSGTLAAAANRYLQHSASPASSQPTLRWQAQLASAIGYDTNTNTATAEQDITLFDGLLRARLSEDQRAQESGYARQQLIGAVGYQPGRRDQLTAALQLSRKDNFGTDDYDLDQVGISVSWQHQSGEHQLRLGGAWQFAWLGREGYQEASALAAGWHGFTGSRWQPDITLALQQIDNRLNDDADALQPSLTLAINSMGNHWQWQLRGQASTDIADDEALQARDILAATTRLSWTNEQALVLLSADYRQSRYQERAPIEPGEDREEQLLRLTLGGQYSLLNWLRATADLSYSRNHSSVMVYQYDRVMIETGLQARF